MNFGGWSLNPDTRPFSGATPETSVSRRNPYTGTYEDMDPYLGYSNPAAKVNWFDAYDAVVNQKVLDQYNAAQKLLDSQPTQTGFNFDLTRFTDPEGYAKKQAEIENAKAIVSKYAPLSHYNFDPANTGDSLVKAMTYGTAEEVTPLSSYATTPDYKAIRSDPGYLAYLKEHGLAWNNLVNFTSNPMLFDGNPVNFTSNSMIVDGYWNNDRPMPTVDWAQVVKDPTSPYFREALSQNLEGITDQAVIQYLDNTLKNLYNDVTDPSQGWGWEDWDPITGANLFDYTGSHGYDPTNRALGPAFEYLMEAGYTKDQLMPIYDQYLKIYQYGMGNSQREREAYKSKKDADAAGEGLGSWFNQNILPALPMAIGGAMSALGGVGVGALAGGGIAGAVAGGATSGAMNGMMNSDANSGILGTLAGGAEGAAIGAAGGALAGAAQPIANTISSVVNEVVANTTVSDALAKGATSAATSAIMQGVVNGDVDLAALGTSGLTSMASSMVNKYIDSNTRLIGYNDEGDPVYYSELTDEYFTSPVELDISGDAAKKVINTTVKDAVGDALKGDSASNPRATTQTNTSSSTQQTLNNIAKDTIQSNSLMNSGLTQFKRFELPEQKLYNNAPLELGTNLTPYTMGQYNAYQPLNALVPKGIK